ncbi:large proline-rich protein bag6-B-like [Achroia grisella]|uniref:large proline-rich protein bag6-B-like n=1 Tax=Achroia grisella TaxID=688607 RepID=UPI0027D2232E|nr:large proline-rich protein bag6-B-like [Achroia grisella]
MCVTKKYVMGFLYLISLNVEADFLNVQSSQQSYNPENVRVTRQAGIQEQQMYYAYPVPSNGDTVNIGYSSSTAGSTAVAGASVGAGSTGEISGVQNTAQASSTGTASGYNYGTQNSATLGSLIASGPTGYNYNTPTSNMGAVQSGSVSTNAPKYLPPIAGTTESGLSDVVNISPTVLPNLVQLPETQYLPPKPATPPPPSQPVPTLAQTPTPTATPAPKPNTEYLPPSTPGYGVVSTPAPTYLPPVL